MRRRVTVSLVVAALAVATGTTIGVASAAAGTDGLAAVKRATAPFHDVAAASAAGYSELVDANGIACIDMPGMGAMGVHYVKGSLVADGALDPSTPEAMVYEPHDGRLQLVAVEYVVFQAAWDAAHSSPPSLFGQTFALTTKPNRFGLDAFYSLHAWVWKHNPAGMFAMWNPEVSCTGNDDHPGHVRRD